MLGKTLRIIELNKLVYKERHKEEKQAQVADDWMINVFGLTSIDRGSSTSGTLDRSKIVKPEVICETPVCQPSSQNCQPLQIITRIYATCATFVRCIAAMDTVYTIKNVCLEIGWQSI
jgi:hypothetical protein